ncbi:hypothetical protein CAR_c03360 [Carnobacterium sp. 17-4]|nr:hypothetical protein CAR_c03360 [Carnobacterium sp. 17-4]
MPKLFLILTEVVLSGWLRNSTTSEFLQSTIGILSFIPLAKQKNILNDQYYST